MQDTGCLGLVHWDDPEGWYGDGGRRGIQDGEHVYTRGRFMLMYDKTNTIYKKKLYVGTDWFTNLPSLVKTIHVRKKFTKSLYFFCKKKKNLKVRKKREM